jgi:hypothetical protein
MKAGKNPPFSKSSIQIYFHGEVLGSLEKRRLARLSGQKDGRVFFSLEKVRVSM